MSKTDTVKAVINGAKVEFRLSRDSDLALAVIEKTCGMPLFSIFRALGEGTWSTTWFAAILSAAHTATEGHHYGRPSGLVVGMLRDHPPGQFAPLVAKVIEAYLFGLDAKEATFAFPGAQQDA